MSRRSHLEFAPGTRRAPRDVEGVTPNETTYPARLASLRRFGVRRQFGAGAQHVSVLLLRKRKRWWKRGQPRIAAERDLAGLHGRSDRAGHRTRSDRERDPRRRRSDSASHW